MNNPFPQFFTDHTDEVVEDIINVNIRANTFITKALLPQMVERNNGGAVLSFGSMFGPLGAPMLAPYSASKAYAYSFSLSLYEEYRAKGIDFLAVNPGYVMSNMSKLKKETWLITSPMTYVNSSSTLLITTMFPYLDVPTLYSDNCPSPTRLATLGLPLIGPIIYSIGLQLV